MSRSGPQKLFARGARAFPICLSSFLLPPLCHLYILLLLRTILLGIEIFPSAIHSDDKGSLISIVVPSRNLFVILSFAFVYKVDRRIVRFVIQRTWQLCLMPLPSDLSLVQPFAPVPSLRGAFSFSPLDSFQSASSGILFSSCSFCARSFTAIFSCLFHPVAIRSGNCVLFRTNEEIIGSLSSLIMSS